MESGSFGTVRGTPVKIASSGPIVRPGADHNYGEITMLRTVAVVVSIIAFTEIAAAADLAYKPPLPVAPAFTWTGWYIGGNAGYDWNDNVDVSSNFSCPSSPCPIGLNESFATISAASSQSISAKGFNAGVQAGYNWQTGSLVLGIEADVGTMDLSGQRSATVTSPSGFTFSPSTSVGTDALATVRGRLGWAVAPTVLLYGTGGLAVSDPNIHNTFSGDADSSNPDIAGPANGASTNERTRAGWAAGGGIEWSFAQHWSVKAEYLRADFGLITTSASVNAPTMSGISPPPNVFSTSTDLKANLVRVGINYLFQ